MDCMTMQPEVICHKGPTSSTIAELLVENVLSRHGILAELLSDQGKLFVKAHG